MAGLVHLQSQRIDHFVRIVRGIPHGGHSGGVFGTQGLIDRDVQLGLQVIGRQRVEHALGVRLIDVIGIGSGLFRGHGFHRDKKLRQRRVSAYGVKLGIGQVDFIELPRLETGSQVARKFVNLFRLDPALGVHQLVPDAPVSLPEMAVTLLADAGQGPAVPVPSQGPLRFEDDIVVVGAAEPTVRGQDDHAAPLHFRARLQEQVWQGTLVVAGLDAGHHSVHQGFHTLSIGPGPLEQALRPGQLGRRDHLHHPRNLLGALDALDAVPDLFQIGHCPLDPFYLLLNCSLKATMPSLSFCSVASERSFSFAMVISICGFS